MLNALNDQTTRPSESGCTPDSSLPLLPEGQSADINTNMDVDDDDALEPRQLRRRTNVTDQDVDTMIGELLDSSSSSSEDMSDYQPGTSQRVST
jgi:hypothetical protein